jgi:hypothetical protein
LIGVFNSVAEQIRTVMINNYGNFDHNTSPEIKISYHPNGNMREFNFVIPDPASQLVRECSQNNLQQHLSRKRLDSGYEEQEEDQLLANRSTLSERHTENQLAPDKLGSIDEKAVQTMDQSSHLHAAQTHSVTETEDMAGNKTYHKLLNNEKVPDGENPSARGKQCLNKMKLRILLFSFLASALVLAILLILLLANQFKSPIVDVELSEHEASKEPGPILQVSEFMHCSKMCTNMYKNITIGNGWIDCENERIWLECQNGFRPSIGDSFVCQDFKIEDSMLECLPLPCLSPKMERTYSIKKDTDDCGQEQVLILAGGASVDDELTNDVSVYPSTSSPIQCLPPIPIPLRWGTLGLLGSTLHLCGGEDDTQQPQSSCWSLSNRDAASAKWRLHNNMTR